MATQTTKNTKRTKPVRARKTTQRAAAEPKRPVKSAFRPTTFIALIALAAVIGAAIYLNQQAETAAEAESTPAAEESFLFAQDAIVNSIEVKPAEGQTVALERNEKNAWVLTQPDEVEADQGLSEAAASQITALRIIDPIENTSDPSIFGLDAPAFIMTIGFEDGTTRVLEIGDKTPTNSGYYVRTDDGKIYVAALSGISALTNLVTTPPYLNTPTPIPTATATSTPLPTATPVPATETSSAPEASPTP
ncbi:MAG: DUF4340 domain-containing protein [Chloroflexi bacterium]|nr:DUF4340 domain-containing protein [Chloroflexota bacterium]